MALKGFQVNGTVYKYDYTALENKPDALPEALPGKAFCYVPAVVLIICNLFLGLFASVSVNLIEEGLRMFG